MRTVHVSLGTRSYDIRIGRGLLKHLGKECSRLGLGNRCAILSDIHVAKFHLPTAARSLRAAGFNPVSVRLPAGEGLKKDWNRVKTCHEMLEGHRLERKSFVVALGGGVVGDFAGFVAATYMRGIAFVQVPTTLLAQVDSSVGGKVGLNTRAHKNFIGAFHQPRLVLCDLETLDSLPAREYRAGLAEVIKYGIIRDAALFKQLERDMTALLNRDPKILAAVVARCCEIKSEVVGKDETENGLRAILNFGHTIGHALEAISSYGKYLHGEAISLGQVAAAEISAGVLGFPTRDVDRIRRLFDRAGLPTRLQLSTGQRGKLLKAMRLDKKVSAGELRFVLAKRIGRAQWGRRVSDRILHQALDTIGHR